MMMDDCAVTSNSGSNFSLDSLALQYDVQAGTHSICQNMSTARFPTFQNLY